MKLAIYTLYGLQNYGNRLQNYALQRVLENLGCQVETLAVVPPLTVKNLAKRFLTKHNGRLRLRSWKEHRKEKPFWQFTKRHIHTRFLSPKDGRIPQHIGNEYDGLVAGSDQVWNPHFWQKGENSADAYNALLAFAPASKRAAYAASFGIPAIPECWEKTIAAELRQFQAISVREETGAEIIRSLTGDDCDVVLDPTMMLTAEEWRSVSEYPPDLSEKKYIVSFFIGNQSGEVRQYIERVKKETGFEIQELSTEDNTVNPAAFLAFLDGAQAVITDSFHATVFSILFHTPFVVMERHHGLGINMNDRIVTLLSAVQLPERMGMVDLDKVCDCDFSLTDALLETARSSSKEYLKKMMERLGRSQND